MNRRGSAFPAHALRLAAVLFIVTVAPAAAAGRRLETLDTTTNAASAGTVTSVDATPGALALDLLALAVDAKTRAQIKALAPLLGSADLTGVSKPPERASYLTKDAFAAAARKWLATVMKRVQKMIQLAGGGGGKGRGSSKGNSGRGNTTTVDRSLGYVPPPSTDPAKLPNLNTVSRYLTVGLTLDQTSQKLTWDFQKSVDHSKLFSPDDEFDQGNCGSCWAYAAARAVQGAYLKLKETDDDVFPSGVRLSVQQLVDCTGAAASCRGGYPEAALQYAAKYGLQDEAGYAYTGASGKCSVNKDSDSYSISMYEQVPLPGPLDWLLANAPSSLPCAFSSLPPLTTPLHRSKDFYNISMYEQVPLPGPLDWLLANAPSSLPCAFSSLPPLTTPLHRSQDFYNISMYEQVPLPGPLDWLLANAPSSLPCAFSSLPPLTTPLHRSQDKWNIAMYEQVPLPGPLGLILALQKQPVIVTIRASAQDFIDYAEGIYEGWKCYSPVGEVVDDTRGTGMGATATATNNTGLLDHVMLAVGYNYVVPGSAQNYFILKNSWGKNWGENGYMKIRMEGDSFGTCGMLVNRGLYPVVNEISTSTSAAVQGTYTVQGGETCGGIYGFIGLTQEQFMQQNKGVDCDNLKAGQVLNISIPSTAQVCRVRYTVTQICIQVGDAVSGAADYNLCTEYQPVTQWFTCATAVANYGMSWLDLYRLNPGISCDSLSTLTASEICVAGTPLGAVACGKARSRTVANRKYTVVAGDSCASLVVVQFQRQPSLMSDLNRGWMCRSQSLFAGMPLCIPS
ncbi:unnamed protein product [Closterium sp. Yama58-4]|nr:unnamed protein product [Closterium sp. Yama58-4]